MGHLRHVCGQRKPHANEAAVSYFRNRTRNMLRVYLINVKSARISWQRLPSPDTGRYPQGLLHTNKIQVIGE